MPLCVSQDLHVEQAKSLQRLFVMRQTKNRPNSGLQVTLDGI